MQSKIQEMMNLLTQLQIEKNKTENTQSQEKNQLIKQNQDLFELNQWYQKKLDKKLKKIETLKKKNKNLQKKLDTYDTYGHENVPKMGTFDKGTEGTFGTLDEIELEAEEDEVQCIEPPVIIRKIKIEDLTKDEPVLEPDDQEMLDELVEIATRAVRKGFLEVKQLKKMEAVVDLEVQDLEVQDHEEEVEVEQEEEVEEEQEEEVEVEQEEEEVDHEVQEEEEEVDHEVQEEEEEVEVEEEEEVEEEVEVEEEEVEVEQEEVEVEEQEEVEVEVEVEQEEEEEEEEEEEQELILVKINKKNYYTTNETNGEIYAIEADESIGDQVGNYKNGKAFFLPKK